MGGPPSKPKNLLWPTVNKYREGKVKKYPKKGVKQFLKSGANKQLKLDAWLYYHKREYIKAYE